jgi:hypothetical protein
VRELDEVLGTRVGVRACVDQHGHALARRDHHGDSRTEHAAQPADLQQTGCQHRTGVPRRDDGVGPPFGDRAVGDDEARVRLAAHGVGGLLVHADHLRRLDQLEAARLEPRGAYEDGLDVGRPRFERAGDDLGRAAVAAEGVDGDPDHRATGPEW